MTTGLTINKGNADLLNHRTTSLLPLSHTRSKKKYIKWPASQEFSPVERSCSPQLYISSSCPFRAWQEPSLQWRSFLGFCEADSYYDYIPTLHDAKPDVVTKDMATKGLGEAGGGGGYCRALHLA